MKKLYRFFKKNKKISVVTFILFLVWFILTFIQIIINDDSLTRIDRRYRSHEISNRNYDPLLKGETRQFQFEATQDNLGSVSINFNTYDRKNTDHLIFRIKEKNAKNWYYESEYNTYAFTTLTFYPFGFPIIHHSKDRTYLFEIESLRGTRDNSVAINQKRTIFAPSYIFDKGKFLHDFPYLMTYIWNKSINSLQNNYLAFTSTVYMFPFLFYLLYVFVLADNKRFNYRSLHRDPFAVLLGITIFYDIVFVKEKFDLLFLVVSTMWLILLLHIKKKSRDTYFAGIILLATSVFLQLMNQDFRSEKAAAWAFLALAIALILNIYAIYTSKK